MILFGENSLQKATHEFLAHYHRERNHQGIDNRILDAGDEVGQAQGDIRCRQRLAECCGTTTARRREQSGESAGQRAPGATNAIIAAGHQDCTYHPGQNASQLNPSRLDLDLVRNPLPNLPSISQFLQRLLVG